ncbi:RNA polymerase sigma factor [Neobacillus notoginsengisoli]|uniref:RNA polymerase sigma factor n=1 Tax=Neobacillus notoginsengisoli TaxID=1578198 RepID=A0A417YW51_9BACI|nr:RNA polymerase sigma factor [Neobacillus notoginsengisoli]RHW41518.1 RNA polymerase sigma factor [Neobacillus notoginsengisoli]
MLRKEIISEWFQQYSHDVYNFLIYYTGKRDVEDLVQETFIKALKGLERFNYNSSPKTWLFTIARNLAIDDARKKKNRIWDKITRFEQQPEGVDSETPETIFEANEQAEELLAAIQKLKQNYREVVILRGIKELSVAETAAVLNWTEDMVRTNYHRALKVLRNQRGGGLNERSGRIS